MGTAHLTLDVRPKGAYRLVLPALYLTARGADMTHDLFPLDLDRLLKLRLVVARFGEMDNAAWWNTDGVLSKKGGLLLSRGFPKTHQFAQARLVFTVARARSFERFPAVPGCVTLWSLPAAVEDAFDTRWEHWIEDAEAWSSFFASLEESASDLIEMFLVRNLVQAGQIDEVNRLRRTAEGRSIPVSGARRLDDNTVTLLAAGFSRGKVGELAVPYVRVDKLVE